MNNYGEMAREYWARAAPVRYAELPQPEVFFADLGEQILTRVDQLVPSLAGPDLPDETYLQKVGRLNAAKKQAEEIVLADMVWIPPETSEDENREEWEATQPSLDSLANWAEEMQRPDREFRSTTPLEQVAEDWMLPEEFLGDLLVQENPYRFLQQNRAALAESAAKRFHRWQQTQEA